jgi:hypothetical protein
MRALIERVSAVDPAAGQALEVIAFFDSHVQGHSSLEQVLRGMAALAGCPVRLIDDARHVRICFAEDGTARDLDDSTSSAQWPAIEVGGNEQLQLILEKACESELDAIILERAAGAIQTVMDRTRRPTVGSSSHDPALVQVVLDGSAGLQLRLDTAQRLGLDLRQPARALCLSGGKPRVVSQKDTPAVLKRLARATRAGIGPLVTIADLPQSWRDARMALRFTAAGTHEDPGDRHVFADDLGALILLAKLVAPGVKPHDDVEALERATTAAPWMLETLQAIATTTSLREAATKLIVHHSTLQSRLHRAQRTLGWDLCAAQGRLRLLTALHLRRLYGSLGFPP